MSLDIKEIPKKAAGIFKKASKYGVFIFVILVLCAYSFVVFRINSLAAHEPEDEIVNDRLNNLRRPKIDQDTINKIQQLEETNVQVKALFDQARDNPFQN